MVVRIITSALFFLLVYIFVLRFVDNPCFPYTSLSSIIVLVFDDSCICWTMKAVLSLITMIICIISGNISRNLDFEHGGITTKKQIRRHLSVVRVALGRLW